MNASRYICSIFNLPICLSTSRTVGLGGLAASGYWKFFVKGGATALVSELLFAAFCVYLATRSTKSEDISIQDFGASCEDVSLDTLPDTSPDNANNPASTSHADECE